MNIAVCEDSAPDRDAICAHITEHCDKNCYDINIFEFEGGEALLDALLKQTFHIIFLDIYLTGITGVETAKKIRESNPDCAIVFITTSTDHALDGYDVSAVSYIVKPIEIKKMEKVFSICHRVFEESCRFIEVMSDYQQIRVQLSKIIYAEVYGKATLLYLNSTKVIRTYMPINKIEELLGGVPFLRCHRCFIVNMNNVTEMREKDFLMKNGDIVPIRKNGRSAVKLMVASYLWLK